jgi:hypothetical protein
MRSPVRCRFGLRNMGVAIRQDKQDLHFGAGQTVAVCHDREKPVAVA